MASNNHFHFAPVGRFFGDVARIAMVAREINDIYNRSESEFTARGTTRADAVRAKMALL